MLRATLCALLVVAATPLGAQEQKQPQAPRPVQTDVALALVLAVDASGSVSDDRFELQKQGYAAAFRNRQVLNSIRSLTTQSIAVTMMQWTGPELHVQTVDWTLAKDEASVNALADAIEGSKRQLFGGGTSISGAIDYSRILLTASPFLGIRRVIDISGDGANNRGRAVTLARDEAVRDGISINGLPILSLEPDLDRYYYDNVIGGPGAFMVPARNYDTFADAILKKLITEIAGAAPNTLTECPLSGVKRTSQFDRAMSASDPQQTSAIRMCGRVCPPADGTAHEATQKPEKQGKRALPVSLSPPSAEDALTALLQINPDAVRSTPQPNAIASNKKPSKRRKVQKKIR